MGARVIICDDSRLARNFLARSLPKGFADEQHFAASGREALEQVQDGQGDLLFLDLNMPDLDGYQVLAALHARQSDCRVIVISGDIQPKARAQVMEMGALAFLPKPLERQTLLDALFELKLISAAQRQHPGKETPTGEGPDRMEVLREVANVAMGRAAGTLAGIYNVFVQIPVPRIQALPARELQDLLEQWQTRPGHQVISQGFVGAGISGEVLMELSSDEAHGMARLMGMQVEQAEEEALMIALSTILIGICLKGMASQLQLAFSQGHPIILERDGIRNLQNMDDRNVLCIRFGYQVAEHNLHQELVLAITPASLPALEQRLKQLVN
ncbi:response regulator [Gallaecimonas sp. GXIMD1310]|uniref:response regulator n=1 Tax=Gallaecimonas sp. GXIMD1310 TaxID=3131926 RepID=UPI00324CBE05